MIKWICWIPLQGGFLMASLNKFIFYFPTFLCYNFYARSHSHFPQERNEGIKKKSQQREFYLKLAMYVNHRLVGVRSEEK